MWEARSCIYVGYFRSNANRFMRPFASYERLRPAIRFECSFSPEGFNYALGFAQSESISNRRDWQHFHSAFVARAAPYGSIGIVMKVSFNLS